MNETIAPSRVLGVFGMSIYTRRDDLEKLFSEYGTIQKVEIIHNRQVRYPRHFFNPDLFYFFSFFCRLEDRRDSGSFTLNVWMTRKLPVSRPTGPN